MLPYSRQSIDEADIAAVVAVLRSDWLTTGPAVDRFEEGFARFTGSSHAVAVSSGTAALLAALHGMGIAPGDEVIVPAMTFVATANAVTWCGAKPVFADCDPRTLLIDPDHAATLVSRRTRAIVAVDYAGQPCDGDQLRSFADAHGLAFLADACHSVGGSWRGRPVGQMADATCFSFHPVKPLTTGEGGMVTTNDAGLARRLKRFRNHGIDTSFRERAEQGVHHYDMVGPGMNLRLSDLQAALGLSQLARLDEWTRQRNRLACMYDQLLEPLDWISPLAVHRDAGHARHLYVVRIGESPGGRNRNGFFRGLRERGIGANVHYRPVHLHSWYRQQFATGPGMCPVAERAGETVLSLPLFPAMTEREVALVVDHLCELACQPAGEPAGMSRREFASTGPGGGRANPPGRQSA